MQLRVGQKIEDDSCQVRQLESYQKDQDKAAGSHQPAAKNFSNMVAGVMSTTVRLVLLFILSMVNEALMHPQMTSTPKKEYWTQTPR